MAMLRNPMLVCAMALAALFLTGTPGTASAQPLPCNFAVKVQFLAPGFIPDQFGTPPPGVPIGEPYASQLNQAFARAPVAFQKQLCNLDGVYIDQTVCTNWQSCFGRSWGFRQRPGGRRYVAISIMLWSGQPIYSRFESALFDSLLAPNFASFGAANPDSFPMTLLAALAHEVGHVRFYDILDPGLTGTLDFGSVCGGNFFSGWAGPPNGLHAPPRWRPLSTPGERHGNPIPDPHRGPPQIQQIDALVQAGNTGQAGDLVNTMLTTQPWASFFAAISPDEDFVETYKLKVLTSAGLRSLPFVVPGTSAPHGINIPANISPALATKMSCIPL
jgi:hypothetical protein